MTALQFNPAAPLLLHATRAFLYALAALVAFRLLNGGISTRGLLKDRETGAISALRLQMLICTAIASVSYAAAISHQTSGHFPAVDARLLALVGGSNGLVIVKRAFSKVSKFLGTNPQL
jgi:hypothetical protein